MPFDVRQLERKRVRRLHQLIKAKMMVHLTPQQRENVRAFLADLDEKYTKNQISIEEYRFLSLTYLMKDWDPARREQFLYREASKTIPEAEKFAIAEFSPQKLPD